MPCFMMATRLRSHPLQAQCEGTNCLFLTNRMAPEMKKGYSPDCNPFLWIEPIFFVLCRILFLGVFAQILFR
jgi:hypothetical protein